MKEQGRRNEAPWWRREWSYWDSPAIRRLPATLEFLWTKTLDAMARYGELGSLTMSVLDLAMVAKCETPEALEKDAQRLHEFGHGQWDFSGSGLTRSVTVFSSWMENQMETMLAQRSGGAERQRIYKLKRRKGNTLVTGGSQGGNGGVTGKEERRREESREEKNGVAPLSPATASPPPGASEPSAPQDAAEPPSPPLPSEAAVPANGVPHADGVTEGERSEPESRADPESPSLFPRDVIPRPKDGPKLEPLEALATELKRRLGQRSLETCRGLIRGLRLEGWSDERIGEAIKTHARTGVAPWEWARVVTGRDRPPAYKGESPADTLAWARRYPQKAARPAPEPPPKEIASS